MSKKLKIAITGGIGSGKSTVAEVFESRGNLVIRADQISKDILSTSPKVREEVTRFFGHNSFENGKPNKQYLAQKVFGNKQNLQKLNSILHPPTIEQIKKIMEDELQTSSLVFVEAALIYEAEMEDMFDHVLVVYSPDEQRIKRIMERDGSSEEEIRRRMNNQIPQEKKKKLADFVINNDKSLVELKIKSEFFLKIFANMTE